MRTGFRRFSVTLLALIAVGQPAGAKQYQVPKEGPTAVIRVNVKNALAKAVWKRYFYVSVSTARDCDNEKVTGRTLTWINLKKLSEHIGAPLKIEAGKEHTLTFQYIDTKLGWTRICTVTGSINLAPGSEVTAEFNIDENVSTCDVSASRAQPEASSVPEFRKLPFACNTPSNPIPSGVGQIYEPPRVKVILMH